MNESEAEFMTELIAVFSTVIVETCRSMTRQSGGSISRQNVALDLERASDKLLPGLDHEILIKSIMKSIAAQLADKPFSSVRVKPDR